MPSIASSKVTMTMILSQRKVGPWKRDIEKTKGTESILRAQNNRICQDDYLSGQNLGLAVILTGHVRGSQTIN